MRIQRKRSGIAGDRAPGKEAGVRAPGKRSGVVSSATLSGGASPGKKSLKAMKEPVNPKASTEVQDYEEGMAMALLEDTTGLPSMLSSRAPMKHGGPTLHGLEAKPSGENSFDGSWISSVQNCAPSNDEELAMTLPRESLPRKKGDVLVALEGQKLGNCGKYLLQKLLEVLPLRSKTMGTGKKGDMFPLPTSRLVFLELDPNLNEDELDWLVCVTLSLNSVWGGCLFFDGVPSKSQRVCLSYLSEQVHRFCHIDAKIERLSWTEFLKVKSIDYKGDEVRVARYFTWKNISPALPAEIGRVPLSDICSHGCKHYVDNFELYLRPEAERKIGKAPRVMVEDSEWACVCKGLVKAGVCGILEEDEIHHENGVPLLNGLFGVTKEDFTAEDVEIFRLIMNLIPLNNICVPLGGDVATLPAWSTMSPFFLQPSQSLLVSSEDVKCFFYVMSVPTCWVKYLAFNKPVPDEALPMYLQGTSRRFYLASLVLPMGFLNSVSLAQHVHRNLANLSSCRVSGDEGAPERELRKDRPLPATESLWRIYLDNYDLLEKVSATEMCALEGTLAPGALALRQEYETWDIPRNVKKSVQRSSKCEVQGATVDGVAGVAYPRESKLAKYFALAFGLMEEQRATQKQWQVVTGGLVYFTMFRRPLLGCLNQVWKHIESFNASGCSPSLALPHDCRIEVVRFLGMLPLAALDFRLPVHPQVTCSDASQ